MTSGLVCLGLGLYLLVGFLLPPARWHRDNRDGWLWLGLVAGSACAFAMPLFHERSQLEYFFHCFFLLNYVPLLARFRFPVALTVLVVEAAFVALLSGGVFGLFLAGYFALQGLALLWLTNAVLLERHFRTETELHATRLAGTRELLQQAVAETERARLELDMALEHGEVSIAEAECLLRCIQEAMTNALKHGRASRVRVALERRPDGLLLQVEDSGRSSPGAPENAAGHGLRGLRERVEALSGRLWTERAPEGFVLYAHLPRETEP